mgnify:CR=1 FL=1
MVWSCQLSSLQLDLSGFLSFANHDDWRLPNIRELQSIIDETKTGAEVSIDLNLFNFPENSGDPMSWSSTTGFFGRDSAEICVFSPGGSPGSGPISMKDEVAMSSARCVRN